MSSATASRPAAGPRSAPAPRSRQPVRPVPAPVAQPARAPFIVLVLVLLSLGLGALLLLNTLLAQGSFTMHSLEAQIAGLADKDQALQQKAAELAAPQRLARRAAALGMVASVNPAFLRAEDGKVLGAPVPAASPSPVVGSVVERDAESSPGRVIQAQSTQQQDKQSQQEDQPQRGQQPGQSDRGNGGTDR